MEYIIKDMDIERIADDLLPALYIETNMYNDIRDKMKDYFSSPIVDKTNKENGEVIENLLAADYSRRINNIIRKTFQDYAV